MTVIELIEELKGYDENIEVKIQHRDGGGFYEGEDDVEIYTYGNTLYLQKGEKMTVEELIKELQKYPKDKRVVLEDSDNGFDWFVSDIDCVEEVKHKIIISAK